MSGAFWYGFAEDEERDRGRHHGQEMVDLLTAVIAASDGDGRME